MLCPLHVPELKNFQLQGSPGPRWALPPDLHYRLTLHALAMCPPKLPMAPLVPVLWRRRWQRGVVLKWFYSISRRNTFVGCTCTPPSALLVSTVSILEYAASVWDPHLAKDINKLENIQRRSARFVKGDYRTTSSVTQMLEELGWQDLQSRCRDLRLALLF